MGIDSSEKWSRWCLYGGVIILLFVLLPFIREPAKELDLLRDVGGWRPTIFMPPLLMGCAGAAFGITHLRRRGAWKGSYATVGEQRPPIAVVAATALNVCLVVLWAILLTLHLLSSYDY